MRFNTWAEFLDYQRRQPYMREISEAVKLDRQRGPVYPAPEDVFRFTETPLAEVKVVILGQDPYHQPGQADGLAFSVRNGTLHPPSLHNVLLELTADLGQDILGSYVRPKQGRECGDANGLVAYPVGNLTPWTRQGVLLLNTALTVREGEAGSHCDIWQPFTDEVIRAVCDSATVAPHFILWGAKAKKALERVLGRLRMLESAPDGADIYRTIRASRSRSRAYTATYSAHPSPLSADKGFFGSRPFSRANLALTLNNPGCAPVDWRLS